MAHAVSTKPGELQGRCHPAAHWAIWTPFANCPLGRKAVPHERTPVAHSGNTSALAVEILFPTLQTGCARSVWQDLEMGLGRIRPTHCNTFRRPPVARKRCSGGGSRPRNLLGPAAAPCCTHAPSRGELPEGTHSECPQAQRRLRLATRGPSSGNRRSAASAGFRTGAGAVRTQPAGSGERHAELPGLAPRTSRKPSGADGGHHQLLAPVHPLAGRGTHMARANRPAPVLHLAEPVFGQEAVRFPRPAHVSASEPFARRFLRLCK